MNKLILEFERKYNHIQEPESFFCYTFKNLKQKQVTFKKCNCIMFYKEIDNKIDYFAKLDLHNMTFTFDYVTLWKIFHNSKNNPHQNYDISYKKTSLLLKKYFGYTKFKVCSSPIAI